MGTAEYGYLPQEVPHDEMELFLKECRLTGIRLVCCWRSAGEDRSCVSFEEIVLYPEKGWVHLEDENRQVIATYVSYRHGKETVWRNWVLNQSSLDEATRWRGI